VAGIRSQIASAKPCIGKGTGMAATAGLWLELRKPSAAAWRRSTSAWHGAPRRRPRCLARRCTTSSPRRVRQQWHDGRRRRIRQRRRVGSHQRVGHRRSVWRQRRVARPGLVGREGLIRTAAMLPRIRRLSPRFLRTSRVVARKDEADSYRIFFQASSTRQFSSAGFGRIQR